MGLIRYVVDLNAPPPVSEEQRARLRKLAAMPDSEIDTSDIPPLTEEFWRNAVRNPYLKPRKASTTVRLDADVLAWFRAQGKGYQTRMNAVLRREMLAAIEGAGEPARGAQRKAAGGR